MSVTKISLVQLITNLNVILYLSTCHTVYISVLILFMIMPQLIINTYVSLMYELKNIVKVFASKFVGTGPSSYKKGIYRAAVSQMSRNTDLENIRVYQSAFHVYIKYCIIFHTHSNIYFIFTLLLLYFIVEIF
jgi:hypothetical protein